MFYFKIILLYFLCHRRHGIYISGIWHSCERYHKRQCLWPLGGHITYAITSCHMECSLQQLAGGMNHPTNMAEWWLSAKMQYIQCISTGDAAVLHLTINIYLVIQQSKMDYMSGSPFWCVYTAPQFRVFNILIMICLFVLVCSIMKKYWFTKNPTKAAFILPLIHIYTLLNAN